MMAMHASDIHNVLKKQAALIARLPTNGIIARCRQP